MNELIREIEEDIRQERFDRLWHSFGRVMVGVSIVVILTTIVIEVIQHKKQSESMESTTAFLKGIERLNIEDYKGAIQQFSTLESDPSSPYYGLTMLRKAQAEAALLDKDSAAKTYHALALHDPVLGQLAALLIPPTDNKPVELAKPLPGSAFYYTSSEWNGWQLLQQGKKDEAVSQFLALYSNPAVPSSMHGRISEVLHHIAADKMPVETSEIKDALHE